MLHLDEPLSNFDAELPEESCGWLRGLIQQLRLSAAYVTDDQIEATAAPERVLYLRAPGK